MMRRSNGRGVAWKSTRIYAIPIACLRLRLLCRGASMRPEQSRRKCCAVILRSLVGAFLKREPWPNPIYREGQAREVGGMRLAGIPE